MNESKTSSCMLNLMFFVYVCAYVCVRVHMHVCVLSRCVYVPILNEFFSTLFFCLVCLHGMLIVHYIKEL